MAEKPVSIYPPLVWIEAADNIFGLRLLDVRGLTLNWSAEADAPTQQAFARLRQNDGADLPGQARDWPEGFTCELRYPPLPHPAPGVQFRAATLEEKWDIFALPDGQLYFCRSWSGQPLLRAAYTPAENGMRLTRIQADPQLGALEQPYLAGVVDFLVKSHIFGLQVPVQAPQVVLFHSHAGEEEQAELHPSQPESVAQYLFHEYGRRAAFACIEDATGLKTVYNRAQYLPGLFPLGWGSLKHNLALTETTVECPVAGCSQVVSRKRKETANSKDIPFTCPVHGIVISPGTFEYPAESDNLLWQDLADTALLRKIKFARRETWRLGRDDSEDALTWNVFRYLDRTSLLVEMLSSMHGGPLKKPQVFYWGVDPHTKSAWADLALMRQVFGERANAGSEPDLVVSTEEALFFIEMKLTDDHEHLAPASLVAEDGYTRGANSWYRSVFRASYDRVAVQHKKYELMRLWLLGSRLATLKGRAFYLATVGPEALARQVGAAFGPLIVEDESRAFLSIAWEQVYEFILNCGRPASETQRLLAYLENKTIGYQDGRLVKAFAIK
jgi:hypothetical protein